ncbi:CVNH domain-containing protein [Microdochium nivale]|nr:CVNH domain-containing protein [Microdochium nivale]
MQYSQIKLNRCLANLGGHLTPRHNGNALDSCFNCHISDDWYQLECTCTTDVGHVIISSIEMNLVLHNWFGYLSCFDEHDVFDGYERTYRCMEPEDWQPDPDSHDDACREGCPELIPEWPFAPPNSGGSNRNNTGHFE